MENVFSKFCDYNIENKEIGKEQFKRLLND